MLKTISALLVFCGTLYAAERPNIVLIMADDVSWEAFGCYGAVDYETPHIDKLAAVEGWRGQPAHCVILIDASD